MVRRNNVDGKTNRLPERRNSEPLHRLLTIASFKFLCEDILKEKWTAYQILVWTSFLLSYKIYQYNANRHADEFRFSMANLNLFDDMVNFFAGIERRRLDVYLSPVSATVRPCQLQEFIARVTLTSLHIILNWINTLMISSDKKDVPYRVS